MKKREISNRAFKAKELYENVWQIQSAMVNSYLVIGTERAAVIDAGYGFANLNQFIRQITNKELFVLLTHGHVDHIAGIRDFDCEIYLNRKDFPVAKAHNTKDALDYGMAGLKIARMITPWRKPLREDFDREAYYSYELPAMKEIRENQVFDLGKMSLKAIELPGHTPGSMGFLLPDYQVLFVGDAMNSNLYLQLPESLKLSQYIETLYRTKNLPFTTFLHGHDRPRPKSYLENYLYIAEHLDFEQGKIMKNEAIFSGSEIRYCRNKQHHAGIVIAKDKL